MAKSTFSDEEIWNSKLWKLKRNILVFIFILVPVSIILLILIVSTMPNRKSREEHPRVCSNDDCTEVASRMLKLLKPSLDPCKDFYAFACGSMLQKTVKEAKLIFDDVMAERLQELVLGEEEGVDPEYMNLPKILTDKCKLSMSQGLDRILADFKNILQKINIPIYQGKSWNEDNKFDLISLTADIRKLGFPADQMVLVAPRVAKTVNLSITTPFTGLSFDVEFYKDFFKGDAKSPETLQSDLEDVTNFSNELHKWLSANQLTQIYTEFKISDLQKEVPYIDWLELLKIFLPECETMTADDTILSGGIDYFKKLESLLADTEKKTIANYIACRLVDFLYKLLDQANLSSLESYDNKTINILCIASTLKDLKLLMIFKYISAYPMDEKLRSVEDMKRQMLSHYEETLNTSNWLDESKKQEAIRKLHKVQFNIAYERELLDPKVLQSLYGNLDYNTNYIELKLQLQRSRDAFEIFNIFHPVSVPPIFFLEKVEHFYWNATYVNCFQVLLASITMGIFEQGNMPFFANVPKYIQYGTTGFVLGHELGHLEIGSEGEFNNQLGPQSSLMFEEKRDCFIKQFDKIVDPVTGVGQSGEITLAENLADSGGIDISYKTYRDSIQNSELEPLLPGLDNYTPHQLFWVSLADLFCEKLSPEEIADHKKSYNTHSWKRNRINGAFSNSIEFSKDFKCPSGTPMNPVKKCHFW